MTKGCQKDPVRSFVEGIWQNAWHLGNAQWIFLSVTHMVIMSLLLMIMDLEKLGWGGGKVLKCAWNSKIRQWDRDRWSPYCSTLFLIIPGAAFLMLSTSSPQSPHPTQEEGVRSLIVLPPLSMVMSPEGSCMAQSAPVRELLWDFSIRRERGVCFVSSWDAERIEA